MEIIKRWIESRVFDFKIEDIDIHNVYENAYRVNLYVKHDPEPGCMMSKISIAKSYFLRLNKENVVTDATIKPTGVGKF